MRIRLFFLLLILFAYGVRLSAQELPPQDSLGDYFLVAQVSAGNSGRATFYVGEAIIYTVRLYAYSVAPFKDVAIPNPVILPNFEGFWRGETYELKADNWRVEVVNGVQYSVGEITVELAPLYAGALVVAPSVLTIPGDMFLGGEFASNPVTVNVEAIPATMPEGYNGAVGSFSMTAQFDQLAVSIGEPIRLSMNIQGTGNFALLPQPDLQFGSAWQVITAKANPPILADRTTVNLQFGRQVFEWLLIPRETGTQMIDSVVFAFFDPDAGQFDSISAPPVEVNVFPSDHVSTGQIPIQAEPLALKSVSNQKALTGSSSRRIQWLWWWLAPVLAVMLGGWRFAQAYQRRQTIRRRAATALKRALERLKSISEAQTPPQTSKQLHAILRAYVADKVNLKANQLSLEVAQALIIRHTQPHTDDLERLQALLIEIEQLAYVPADLSATASQTVSTAKKVLIAVEQGWTA